MEKEKFTRILRSFLVFVLFSLLLLWAENLGWITPIRSVAEMLTVPAKIGIYRVGQKIFGGFSDLISWRSSARKIDELEKALKQLAELSLKVKVLEEENQALRKQLEAPFPPNIKFLPARTLGLSRYLNIDKGRKDGVRPGMMVVSENILVGRVVTVTPRTAQIILPTDPYSKIPAYTLKTRAHGLVLGEFSTEVIFDKVLQAENLRVEDFVATSGEGDYRPDLLIGRVTRIEKVATQPFQKAEVSPLLDYGKLVNVFVMTGE